MDVTILMAIKYPLTYVAPSQKFVVRCTFVNTRLARMRHTGTGYAPTEIVTHIWSIAHTKDGARLKTIDLPKTVHTADA